MGALQQNTSVENEHNSNKDLTLNEKEAIAGSSSVYTRFGHKAKIFLSIVCASCGLFSAIAAPIYYPALDTIKNEFNVSGELLNISVVVYFIFQGISPSIMGGFADSWGRRPIIVWSLAVYFAACVGLAKSTNYGQILGLRCLQSAGISPVIALNSGLMGDVTLRHERGGYIGLTSGIQLVGSAFGAIIGAGLISRWDWRAVFWFLAIGSGISLIISTLLMPETNRSLAGNGSILPKSLTSRAPILALPFVRKYLHIENPDLDTLKPRRKVNFLAPFTVLAVPSVLLVLCVAGMQFTIYSCQLTVLSSSLENYYGLSVGKVGLCYLPSGICTLIGIVSSGRILNWNYERRFAQHEKTIEEMKTKLMEKYYGDVSLVDAAILTKNKYGFNIYRARLEVGVVPMLFSFGGFIAFGWCLGARTHLALVLFFSGFSSLCSSGIIACTTTLMVDLHPEKTSSAAACLNLCRCLLAAAFIAALDAMIDKMTIGGAFTFMVGVSALLTIGMVFVVSSAMTTDTADELT
ncbi:LANO_0A00364g1_1 [Lachancea nothofagi CBS 11611]|uniref:LANO_0A00364g1_1 n=1 Tax=Lachancea nothofagi CBS 11611 TaxID=1266666 RepID=A0A1G4ILI9_9SACH|nr:LANO_0A00364g1_1 [Lachancea nothofagi CBS 11611]